ncbi:WD repeat and HMG-box DNA-binding protein 1-like [Diaphorina citri]|uniref:WD repeat and HMG-box DNA-binding protein 1-like n=1 Tax=Diaphorina citri TaxID=121845 RepID=A0A3Q0JDU6_DIACI|nr:WD repeat and HMG-box DNA-binding protein 1-like [Diaphorina citri]
MDVKEQHESGLPLDEIGEAMLIDDIGEDDNDDNVISLDKIKAQSGFLPDDEGTGAPQRSRSPSVADEDRQTPTSGIYPSHATMPVTELQPAFQPTSTPTHFQYRFMVYNDVGMVRHTNTEEENSIDNSKLNSLMEWLSFSFPVLLPNKTSRINNIMGHTLAALSTKALVLACEREEDKPSKLSCIVINSWDGSKEWSLDFPDEDILAVAAGGSFIASASDKRLLRIFSVGGVQREIISLPGPVVCLNAKDSLLLAVYHSGQGVPEDQNLQYIVYHVNALHRSKGPLPLSLSPRSTLRWAGFSEEGSVLSYDSECVLRLSQQFTGSCVWRPVCFMDDLTKGKSDHYFVVSVSESSHSIQCILCKGCFYPATVPRPILTQVSWKVSNKLCEPYCTLLEPYSQKLYKCILVRLRGDMKVHAFNLSSGAEKVITTHNGPILEVALDPQLEYLATSCCDGLVRMFSMESIVNSEDAAPVQTWSEFIPKSNDFETSPVCCRVAWCPGEGQWLAIPHQSKVHLYQRDSWVKSFSVAHDGCEFQVVRFSPCGKYLAAGGTEGDITVWRLEDRSLLYSGSGDNKRKICSLEWNPADSNEIAYCDTEGQLGLIEQILDAASPRNPSYKSEEIATLTKEVLAPAVKLFAHSCKSDNDLRAIELCELFSNPQFLQLAFRYATSTGKASLAEKVTNLKSSNNEQDMCRRRSPSPSYQFSGDSQSSNIQNNTVDIFGDDSYRPSLVTDSNNIILSMKQKQQVVVKPQNVALGRVNPFKRNNSSNASETKTDVIAEMTVKSQQKPVSTPAETKPVSTKEKSTKSQVKFTEWFSKEKETSSNPRKKKKKKMIGTQFVGIMAQLVFS